MNPLIQLLILATLATLEHDRTCPECEEYLDSGMGFDRRDFECTECDFFTDYPTSIYFALMIP